MSNYNRKLKKKLPKYPIATQLDCITLLNKGYTLQNITGGIVTLNGNKQVIIQKQRVKRRVPYSFNNPKFWQVIDSEGNPLKVEVTRMDIMIQKLKEIFRSALLG